MVEGGDYYYLEEWQAEDSRGREQSENTRSRELDTSANPESAFVVNRNAHGNTVYNVTS